MNPSRLARTAATALLVAFATGACGTSDVQTSTKQVLSTTVQSQAPTASPPGLQSGDPFDELPIPEGIYAEGESGTPETPCRAYTSAAPPFTVIADLADALAGQGWTVGDQFNTGYEYDDTASITATKGPLTVEASAAGSGTTRSSTNICISIE